MSIHSRLTVQDYNLQSRATQTKAATTTSEKRWLPRLRQSSALGAWLPSSQTCYCSSPHLLAAPTLSDVNPVVLNRPARVFPNCTARAGRA